MECNCKAKSKLDRKKHIEAYYKPKIGKGLPDFEVLGWESKEAQYMRFEIFTSNVDIKNKKILDVGCGLGNLLEYLIDKGINIEYTGVDILEDMIESVKRKNLPGKFYCMDIFKQHPFERKSFDIVYTSGIFNLNMGNNMDFLKKAFGRFAELSKEKVVFNLLDRNSPDKEDTYYYYDHNQVVSMLLEQYPQVDSIEVVRGYLNNDFTVFCTMKI
ncbi:class I SAM-dependent methyltransferase [Acetivibrio clariflavus]|uniref:Methylase involved in ubiquinone/menaquinone biosynthesis n=1 Tax=Acetivibrio clariflavus (strain DSM 19732 / NBRC 101661 / EBR45) TaxID=720554 RepID=G8M1N2_ACECE|nr:class I SAM-dependent methyltransferase [Acetivibrio clariflavus]AEV70261.1 methylase involved in ubiquinone/menaquinone biosynthesis [Acetivibrio clariflavus DSM 19732]